MRPRGCARPPGSCAARSGGACTSAARPSCTSRTTTRSSARSTSNDCFRKRAHRVPRPRRRMTTLRTRPTTMAYRSPAHHPTMAPGRTRTDASIDGVLPVDKPAGPTSHGIVARVRRALGTRRIGHTGTLDPFASGLMLLCIGRATRIVEYLTGMDKRYTAVVRLGTRTDTHDATGTVLSETDASDVTLAQVESALEPLRGEIDQVPPAFSAKKVAGERAYALAREGAPPELPPARVRLHR